MIVHPTSNKIGETVALLENEVAGKLQELLDVTCTVVSVDGEMSADETSRLCEPSDECLKIVVTSVLEASITIEGVVPILDSCLMGAAEFAPGPKVESISSFRARLAIERRRRRGGRAGRTPALFRDVVGAWSCAGGASAMVCLHSNSSCCFSFFWQELCANVFFFLNQLYKDSIEK